MMISKKALFAEGRTIWQEYVNLNGYAFEPSTKGIAALAKASNQKPQFIRERITAFLEA